MSGAALLEGARALAIAREIALLGARSALASPDDRLLDHHGGFEAVLVEQWRALGELARGLFEAPQSDHDRTLIARLDELGLVELDLWLLALCGAAELYPDAAAALSILAEDERVQLPSPASAARVLRAALGSPYAEVLIRASAGGPLQRLGLVELVERGPGRPRTHAGLRLPADELAALLANPRALGRSRSLHTARERPAASPALPTALVAGAAQLLIERDLLFVRSRSPRAARQLALDLAGVGRHEAALITTRDADALPSIEQLLRQRGALVVLDLSGLGPSRPLPLPLLEDAAASLGVLVVLVGAQASTGRHAVVEVDEIGVAESRRIWAEVIEDELLATSLARRFRVALDEARDALGLAQDRVALSGRADRPTAAELTAAVRDQGAQRMGRAVTRLRSSARLDDLVVPAQLAAQLRDIVGWVRADPEVRSDWGLRQGNELGLGLACLFSGPPGTGKTFAAQCLANELGLNLYRVDLSQVISKWIGETEKALATIFDEAEAGHGLLLFDEADALFSRRTEVRDANDRWANVEVGFLLQRLEAFGGVALLTTNLRSNIDGAFVRRLRFVVEFPMPDRQLRAALWERALPPPERREPGLDVGPLVDRFKLSGGMIHNIGLAAAHLAAASGRALGPAQVVRATQRELEKAGFARSPADFGPLAAYLQPAATSAEERAS